MSGGCSMLTMAVRFATAKYPERMWIGSSADSASSRV